MGLANKVNSTGRKTVAESINTKELEYFKAKELIGSDKFPIRLKGYFIQTGKYGESITVVADDFGINLPKRYVDMFKAFTDEEVEQLKAGCLAIADIAEFDGNNGKTVTIDFVDMEPEELPFE